MYFYDQFDRKVHQIQEKQIGEVSIRYFSFFRDNYQAYYERGQYYVGIYSSYSNNIFVAEKFKRQMKRMEVMET